MPRNMNDGTRSNTMSRPIKRKLEDLVISDYATTLMSDSNFADYASEKLAEALAPIGKRFNLHNVEAARKAVGVESNYHLRARLNQERKAKEAVERAQRIVEQTEAAKKLLSETPGVRADGRPVPGDWQMAFDILSQSVAEERGRLDLRSDGRAARAYEARAEDVVMDEDSLGGMLLGGIIVLLCNLWFYDNDMVIPEDFTQASVACDSHGLPSHIMVTTHAFTDVTRHVRALCGDAKPVEVHYSPSKH